MAWQEDGYRRLDALLRAGKVTSTSIGKGLGVDRSLVSRWRSGERVPDADQLAYMVTIVSGSADYVLGLDASWPARERARADRKLAAIEAVLRGEDPNKR